MNVRLRTNGRQWYVEEEYYRWWPWQPRWRLVGSTMFTEMEARAFYRKLRERPVDAWRTVAIGT